jgi:hypothetical protein
MMRSSEPHTRRSAQPRSKNGQMMESMGPHGNIVLESGDGSRHRSPVLLKSEAGRRQNSAVRRGAIT